MATDIAKKENPKIGAPAPAKIKWWLSGWRVRWLLVFVLLLSWKIYDILLGGNFHTVLKDQCYRGGQPSAEELRHIIKKYGIRTVINLRGISEGEDWYPREIAVAKEMGVKLVDVGMWSNVPPEVPEFRNLIKSLAEDDGPFFVHCHTGSDRTGLGSALFLLLNTDTTLEKAREQLGLYYGHIPGGRASCQDRVLDTYAHWLESQGLLHSPANLRRWGMEVYDGKVVF